MALGTPSTHVIRRPRWYPSVASAHTFLAPSCPGAAHVLHQRHHGIDRSWRCLPRGLYLRDGLRAEPQDSGVVVLNFIDVLARCPGAIAVLLD